jgi:hypothetical protein
MLTTFFVMYGHGYTLREKIFFAVAWTPKVRVVAGPCRRPSEVPSEVRTPLRLVQCAAV